MSKELSELKELIVFMQTLEQQIQKQEEQLNAKKSQLDFFKTDIIPDYIMGLGLSEIRLDDGQHVALKPSYFASISEARRTEAFEFLRKSGHNSSIKVELKLSFGAGMEEILDCMVAKQFLEEKSIHFEEREGVHPQTLKSIVKQMMESGINFPQELFGVFIKQEVIVGKQTKTK